MKQSRTMSMVEAVTNVVVGYVLAIATQIVVFPWFGIETGLADPVTLAEARSLTFAHRRKVLLVSTPTIRGPRRVTKTGSAQTSDPATDPATDAPDTDDSSAEAETDPAQADPDQQD